MGREPLPCFVNMFCSSIQKYSVLELEDVGARVWPRSKCTRSFEAPTEVYLGYASVDTSAEQALRPYLRSQPESSESRSFDSRHCLDDRDSVSYDSTDQFKHGDAPSSIGTH